MTDVMLCRCHMLAQIGPSEQGVRSLALLANCHYQAMYTVQFAHLVDLDKPEVEVDVGKSRKRKEPHDMDQLEFI